MRTRPLLTVLASLAALAGLVGPGASAATAAPTWAPAGQASVHPGVQTVADGAQCTANFVFTDGTDVYLGQAAHCTTTGDASQTDGCDAGSLPLGTPIDIQGASRPGTLAYSSWLAMQAAGETNPDTCAFNDFALVRIHPADHHRVNPSVPFWGGPVGLGDATAPLSRVYSYGSSSLRLGLTLLSPKVGFSLGTNGGGWNHPVYTLTPGIPGDSGSAFLDGQGRAIGVLSTLQLAPLVASNGVSDLGRALRYLDAHSSLDVELVPGTEAFSPLL